MCLSYISQVFTIFIKNNRNSEIYTKRISDILLISLMHAIYFSQLKTKKSLINQVDMGYHYIAITNFSFPSLLLPKYTRTFQNLYKPKSLCNIDIC